jgi:hypothetical protein
MGGRYQGAQHPCGVSAPRPEARMARSASNTKRRTELSAGGSFPRAGPFSSQPSKPGLMEGVVLILVARLAGELPAMVVCRHRVGKCQRQGIGKIG